MLTAPESWRKRIQALSSYAFVSWSSDFSEFVVAENVCKTQKTSPVVPLKDRKKETHRGSSAQLLGPGAVSPLVFQELKAWSAGR